MVKMLDLVASIFRGPVQFAQAATCDLSLSMEIRQARIASHLDGVPVLFRDVAAHAVAEQNELLGDTPKNVGV